MKLAEMIREKRGTGAATVTLATIATDEGGRHTSVAKVATVTVANPQRAELRSLIWALLWDVSEAEREAELTRCLEFAPEALAMYGRCHAEYDRLGEQPHG